jgi:hypothetical protein
MVLDILMVTVVVRHGQIGTSKLEITKRYKAHRIFLLCCLLGAKIRVNLKLF